MKLSSFLTLSALMPMGSYGLEQAALFRNELDPTLARVVMNAHVPSVALEQVERVHNPVNLISLSNGDLLVASFMTNRLIVRPLDKSSQAYVLIDSGPHCHQNICTILDGPWGLLTRNGELVVSSFGTDQLLRFSLLFDKTAARWNVQFISAFGSSDSVDCPEGIALDPFTNEILVASFLDDQIVRFEADSQKHRGTFTQPQQVQTRIKGPEDLCVGPGGQVVISSYYGNQLVRLPRNRDDHRFEKKASVPGPVGVLCVEDGVLVASYKSSQIHKFDYEGKPLGVIATGGGMRGPSGMALSLDGEVLFVASYDNNRVIAFNISSGAAFDVFSAFTILA